MTSDIEELRRRDQLAAAAERLHDQYIGVFAVETIEGVLTDSYRELAADARYTMHLPVLAERSARERLIASTREGTPVPSAPTVLFLCVHNAGRSQMAAGWMRHLGGDDVTVLSGGSAPAERINPAAIEVMAEVGIDLTSQVPRSWTAETLAEANVVVTMGCGDTCPVLPGRRYLDWELPDPAGKPVDEVRPIRDDIGERVRQLLVELGVPPRT